MTPFDDFAYLINHVLLGGDEPTIEDFILLIGTIVAFIAFILWCCFPIHPKENSSHQQFPCKSVQHSLFTQQQNYPQTNYSKNCSSNQLQNYSLNNKTTGEHTYHYCST